MFPNIPSEANVNGPTTLEEILPKLLPVPPHNAFAKKAPIALAVGRTYGDTKIGPIVCDSVYAVKLENGAGVVSNVMFYLQTCEDRFEQMFVPGAQLASSFLEIGESPEKVLIVEGYRDAEYLHSETKHVVAAALFPGNVGNVARAMKSKYPDAEILIGFVERTSDCAHRRKKIMQEAAESNSLAFSTLPAYTKNLKGPAQKKARAALQLAIEAAYIPTPDLEFNQAPAVFAPEDPLPWGEPIHAPAIVEHIIETFKKYVSTTQEEMLIVALWVFFTYLVDIFDIAPILAIHSPEKRCGKTTFFEVIMRLVLRPLSASNITSAGLFRAVDAYKPTLGLDEADTFLNKPGEITGIVNSGHKRGVAKVIRADNSGRPQLFDTFCPKVIAMIGSPEGTNGDRMIGILMRRKNSLEILHRLGAADELEFVAIRSQIKKWADDYKHLIKAARPPYAELTNDRAIDNYDPLLKIASCIGQDCLQRANAAIMKIEESNNDDRESIGEQLLRDIQYAFKKFSGDRMPTKILIEFLCRDPEKPWSTYHRSKEITPDQLAKLLKKFRKR